jgi:hypothetical protein
VGHLPGTGLSSPTVNVLWALLYLVCRVYPVPYQKGFERVRSDARNFFTGIAAMSIMGSVIFAKKDAE